MNEQEVYLEPSQDGSSYALNSNNIQIHTSRNYETARDSGKVKSTALVDYRWEVKFYKGNLVAVHKDGEFLAYILHGTQSRGGCAVRVFHRPTKHRALIKGFTGQALDIAWAFTTSPAYLAIVDEGGSLFVYFIQSESNEIKYAKYFHLKRSAPLQNYRVAWCPYVAEDPMDSSSSMNSNRSGVYGSTNCDTNNSGSVKTASNNLRSFGLLAVSHGNTMDVIDLDPLIENHGRDVDVITCHMGFATFSSRSEIQGFALSPDATALAVANQSGEVVFYIMETLSEVREAHNWVPHKGKQVSTILFLDDITVMSKDAHFWKYALTASEDNRELKIYNCENWTCVSTLIIGSPFEYKDCCPLVLSLDWTASFLFISDIDRKALYILQIKQDVDTARFVSFTEFPLVQPALSLSVVESSKKRFRPFSPGGYVDIDRIDDGEEDCAKITGVRALLYAVNPKSLLELEIRYQPNVMESLSSSSSSAVGDSYLNSTGSIKQDSFRDELSDLSVDSAIVPPPAGDLSKVLMTVDDFNMNTKKLIAVGSPTDSATPVDRTPTKELEHHNERQTSNSPSSQEVRSIMSHSANHEKRSPGGDSNVATTTESASNLIVVAHQSNADAASTNFVYTMSDNVNLNTHQFTASNLGKLSASSNSLKLLTDVDHVTSSGGGNNAAILDSVMKLKTYLDRVLEHIQRQEMELQQLQSALINQSEAIQNLNGALRLGEQQSKSNDELVKNCEELVRTCQSHFQTFSNDRLKLDLTQVVQDTVRQQLDQCVKDEIRNTVTSVLSEITKTAKDTIQQEIAQKLTTSDAAFKDSVSKMVKSKPVLEALSQSAAQAIANDAHASYKQVFQSVVAPSFESASRSLFTQMNEIFRTGTVEYLDQLKLQTNAARTHADELKANLNAYVNNLSENVRQSFEKQTANLAQSIQNGMEKCFQQTTHKMFSQDQQQLLHHVRTIVKDELAKSVADNQQQCYDAMLKAFRSQAATPVVSASPQMDRQLMQKELSQLIQQNNYSLAFQQALNAQDLNLVMYVCSKLPPADLFAMNPCPLPQAVILSLIQQLSIDLTLQTDLKLKYLTEAVPSIDVTKNSTNQNPQQPIVNRVMNQLEQNLNAFLSNAPNSAAYARQIKILIMAARSLVH